MYTILRQLVNYWEEKQRKNWWYFLVIMIESATFAIVTFVNAYIIAPYVKEIPCFAEISQLNVAIGIWCIFIILILVIVLVGGLRSRKKEAKDRLENRVLSDYMKKYQKYVDFVKYARRQHEYQDVYLVEDWIKQFDENLDNIARLCDKLQRPFTEFELVACLLYALTYKAKGSATITNLKFAFYCARAFLSAPNIYACKRIEGEELILEKKDSLQKISFDNISNFALEEIQNIIGVYLSQRENYSQYLELADFLHIFYLRCDK